MRGWWLVAFTGLVIAGCAVYFCENMGVWRALLKRAGLMRNEAEVVIMRDSVVEVPLDTIRLQIPAVTYPTADVDGVEPISVTEAEKVKKVYTKEIGVREATNNNDGARVEEYLATTGFVKGSAWCASFVTWCFLQADVKAVVSAWSPSWFPASAVIYTHNASGNKEPRTADVFGIYYQNLGRIAHVGFVDEWPANQTVFVTVEGNTNDTGSREGDGVYKKRRLKAQIQKVARYAN